MKTEKQKKSTALEHTLDEMQRMLESCEEQRRGFTNDENARYALLKNKIDLIEKRNTLK